MPIRLDRRGVFVDALGMELTAASASAIQQANIESQIATKVAVKAQDAQKAEGEAVIALLESAAASAEQSRVEGRGGTIDVRG